MVQRPTMRPRAYLAGLPGLPGKALASHKIVSDTKQMTKERKKKEKKMSGKREKCVKKKNGRKRERKMDEINGKR